MVSDSYISLPEDGIGKKTRTISEVIGTATVHSQVTRNSNVAGTIINPATEDTLTSGSQKTQIVDAGGEVATVTGGKLDVNASIDTTGLATSNKQLADNHQVQVSNFPASQTVAGSVSVSNHPSEFPLPASQVTTLTPPAAITGFATSTKQLADNHQVTVSNMISTSGLALAANQLPSGHAVQVNNLPSEYPLPASQVTTLTPPAAITGFATSVKQLADNHQVQVSNFPASQTVAGSVSVSNFPGTQPVSGSVSVSNMIPAVETGLATAALQGTANTALGTINTSQISTNDNMVMLTTALQALLDRLDYGLITSTAKRLSVDVNTGTIGTVTTVTTVTTAATLTNQTRIGDIQAQRFYEAQADTAYNIGIFGNITF